VGHSQVNCQGLNEKGLLQVQKQLVVTYIFFFLQGTIMGLAAFTLPEIAKMISSAALLCPITYLDHVSARFVVRAVAMHLDQVIYYSLKNCIQLMP
jgi:hypothetical protein